RVEQCFTREGEIEHARQREDVREGAGAVRAPQALLGRGVAERAHRNRAEGGGEPLRARDAEIGNLHDFGFTEATAQDIARREIAVHYAHAVNRMQAGRQTFQRVRCTCGVEGDAGALDRALHAIFERGASTPPWTYSTASQGVGGRAGPAR